MMWGFCVLTKSDLVAELRQTCCSHVGVVCQETTRSIIARPHRCSRCLCRAGPTSKQCVCGGAAQQPLQIPQKGAATSRPQAMQQEQAVPAARLPACCTMHLARRLQAAGFLPGVLQCPLGGVGFCCYGIEAAAAGVRSELTLLLYHTLWWLSLEASPKSRSPC